MRICSMNPSLLQAKPAPWDPLSQGPRIPPLYALSLIRIMAAFQRKGAWLRVVTEITGIGSMAMKDADPLVLWFEDLSRGDVALVGGKNSSLGEMVRQLAPKGIQVPPGFATTAQAFRDYLECERP